MTSIFIRWAPRGTKPVSEPSLPSIFFGAMGWRTDGIIVLASVVEIEPKADEQSWRRL
jgi:hypothetical protein